MSEFHKHNHQTHQHNYKSHTLSRLGWSLGIRTGKEVAKISAQLMRGPVLLQQDNTQAALGFGMASKVLVDFNGRDER